MKKLLLLLLLLYLICESGFTQIGVPEVVTIEAANIPSDSVNLSPNKDFEKRLNLKPIDESGNKVEIRFYKHQELSSTKDLKVLELKSDSWKGTQYSESNYPQIKIQKFDLVAQNGFGEVVKLLLQSNLTSLPNQDELESKMKKFTDTTRGRAEQKVIVSDGYSYTVEFKIGDKFRIYSFKNPDTYSAFYDEVQELKDFVSIKNIFESELKRK